MKFKIRDEGKPEEVLEFWLEKDGSYGKIELYVNKVGGGLSTNVCILAINENGTFKRPGSANKMGITTDEHGRISESK